ncbi:MAG: 50S ribosomal protein L17 [Patescibacteria group bacterium]|nr:50S ribosomal protein L17 [Patescibacteria group bacterium]
MRHQKRVIKIGSDKDHRTSLLRTLAMQVIIHEKVKTTSKRVKAVQPFVEKLITIAKTKDKMNAIRRIEKLVQHKDCSKKLIDDLAIRYKDRTSGYTKTYNMGSRAGDNAPMVQIELINSAKGTTS